MLPFGSITIMYDQRSKQTTNCMTDRASNEANANSANQSANQPTNQPANQPTNQPTKPDYRPVAALIMNSRSTVLNIYKHSAFPENARMLFSTGEAIHFTEVIMGSSFFLSFFLHSSIGGVAFVTVFNSSATWAATFRLSGVSWAVNCS